MGVKVTIALDGLETVLSNLDSIGGRAESNLVKQAGELAKDGKDAWGSVTPERSGKLRGGEQAEAAALTITFMDDVYYYKFVNDPGHMTPAGWHTKHGYRPAHRRSHVPGKPMTETLVNFLSNNIEEYLSKFVDG